MTKVNRTERLKAKLIELKWRQTAIGKWAHSRFGNRRFTLRGALLKSRIIADPRSPLPLDEKGRIQLYRDQMFTPLRQMKVSRVK